MKKYVTHPLIAVATLLSTTSGNAFEFEFPLNHGKPPEIEIVDFVRVGDLTEDMLQKIMNGDMQNIAIEFPKDEQLPLELFIGGDLISLVQSDDMPTFIKFNKSIYIRNHHGKLFLSADLHHWSPFERFVTGTLKVLLSIEESQGPVITLGADLYERISPDPHSMKDQE